MSKVEDVANLSWNSLRSKLNRRLQQFRFRHHAHGKSYDWKWREKGFNRIAVVNNLIAQTRGLKSSYLEIGCGSNILFNSVACLKKIGVDPVAGGTHRMTSDAFFDENNDVFDVIFIDGLHEYEQVRRDATNALNCLKDGGWIVFHDFLPSNWIEQHIPRISETWTGDCWKLAVELTQADGIEFKIINIDHGVGLMKKTSSDWKIPDLSDDLRRDGFDKFVEVVDELPICTFEEAMSLVE